MNRQLEKLTRKVTKCTALDEEGMTLDGQRFDFDQMTVVVRPRVSMWQPANTVHVVGSSLMQGVKLDLVLTNAAGYTVLRKMRMFNQYRGPKWAFAIRNHIATRVGV